MFYHVRYYDPGIGRFVSADSIVPGNASGSMDGIAYKPLTVDVHEPGFVDAVNRENQLGPWFTLSDEDRQQLGSPWGPVNPQALNRYSYVLNNPMKWTDPGGHCPSCAVGAILAGAGITLSAPALVAIAAVLTVSALIIFLSDPNNRSWLMEQVRNGITNVETFKDGLILHMGGRKADVNDVRRIANKYGLSDKQRRYLHDLITKKGYSLEDIEEIAQDIADEGSGMSQNEYRHGTRRGR